MRATERWRRGLRVPRPCGRRFRGQGAPETIAGMLAVKPAFYDATHKRVAAQGSRVIALAYKWMPDGSAQHVKGLARDEVESGLVFAGFLAFHCPVKPDSRGSVELLLQSSHRVRTCLTLWRGRRRGIVREVHLCATNMAR